MELPLNDKQDGSDEEAVVRLFFQHQRWLFGYLTSLMGNPSDAEDVLQEVCVVVWQQREKFEVGTNFVSWLSVIAYHQVQKFWRENRKRSLFANQELIDQLADSMPLEFDLLEARRRALAECTRLLNGSDRQLLAHCYGDRKITAKVAALELGRPADTVYKALNRIRNALFDCINRKIATEGIGE